MSRTKCNSMRVGGLALVLAVSLSMTAAAVTLPFTEDFSGTAPDFTFGGGDNGGGGGGFSVGSGTLNLASGPQTQSAAVQVTDDLSTTPARMNITFSASSFSGNSDIGFAAFGETADFAVFADEHYLADLKPNGAMRILRINQPGTAVTTVATGDFGTFSTSETYDLTLTTTPQAGGNLGLKLAIDAPSIAPFWISGTDSSPLSGSFFGVRARESGAPTVATFDDFSIGPPPPPPEPAIPPIPSFSWLFDNSDDAQFGDVDGTREGTGGSNPSGPAFISGSGDTPLSYTGNASLSYDGTDDLFRIPDGPALRPGTDAWSTSLWFRAPDADQVGPLLAKRQQGGDYNQWQQQIGTIGSTGVTDASQEVSVLLRENSSGNWWYHTANDVADGDWHHMAVVRPAAPGADTLVYIDGGLAAMVAALDNNNEPQNVNNTLDWLIGFNNDTVRNLFLLGDVDEVAMWRGVELSPGNVAWLSQNSLHGLPEPSSLVIFLGLAVPGGLAWRPRRRRSKN